MKKRVHLLFVVTMLFLFGMTFPMLACWGPDCDPCYEGDYCTWDCDSGESCCEDSTGEDGECCDSDYCCGYACQECCPGYSSHCSGCQTCQSYTCQDDDNECVGCESCNNGTCEDDDNNCSSPDPFCIDAVCEECKVDGDCDTCQRCNQTTHSCEDVEVTSISGVSGNYYKGSEETVSATVSGGTLPDNGCTIAWGGDASFSNQSGLTATATLDTCGTYLTITAETSVQSSPEESDPFTVAEIVQFHAKGFPTFPKCQDNSIGKNDFVININPDVQSIKDDVAVSCPDGTAIPPEGTHTAYATLWGKPDPDLEADYEVKPYNGTIVCREADDMEIDETQEGPGYRVKIGDDGYTCIGYLYKTKVTATGSAPPDYGDISEWVPCGTTGQWVESTGFTVNGGAKVEFFDFIEISFGLTYQSSSSVSVQVSAPLGYDMAVKGYSYPIDITTIATSYERFVWTCYGSDICTGTPDDPIIEDCDGAVDCCDCQPDCEWVEDYGSWSSEPDIDHVALKGGWVTCKRCSSDCTE